MKKDNRDELDERLKAKIWSRECICETELLDRLHEILAERGLIEGMSGGNSETTDTKANTMGEYISERMSENRKEVPEFDEGYVVLDVSDNHVLDNAIFDNVEDANSLKETYQNEMPSLVENEYTVMKVTHDCLQYGAFPNEDTIYFIYDIEQ